MGSIFRLSHEISKEFEIVRSWMLATLFSLLSIINNLKYFNLQNQTKHLTEFSNIAQRVRGILNYMIKCYKQFSSTGTNVRFQLINSSNPSRILTTRNVSIRRISEKLFLLIKLLSIRKEHFRKRFSIFSSPLNAATYEHVGFVVSIFSAFFMKIDYSMVSFDSSKQLGRRGNLEQIPLILTH